MFRTNNSKNKNEFTSEGFDLSATCEEQGDGEHDVVYELGGGVTSIKTENENDDKKKTGSDGKEDDDEKEEVKEINPTDECEDYKQRGNEAYKNGKYEEACEWYGKAMDAAPGEYDGSELMEKYKQWEKRKEMEARRKFESEQQRERAEREKELEEKRKLRQQQRYGAGDNLAAASKEEKTEGETREKKGDDDDVMEDDEEEKQRKGKEEEQEVFRAPVHTYGTKVAVYHCNRAAALLQLKKYEEAVWDCDVARLLNPAYVKAYVRRSSANEQLGQTDKALADMETARKLDPTNATVKNSVERLRRLENERMEKLKAETLDKLKDLGNSILGNFGLSLDNFEAKQDPNTGSYSIAFNQNK